MSDTDARAARLALERLMAPNAWGLPDRFLDDVERFVALLLDANTRLNLTRVVEATAVATFHLLDSLAALPVIDRLAPARAIDLGSGGGVPGVVLALARRDVRWTLVDSVRKKADALRSIVSELGLDNVEVEAERAELLGREAAHREGHDVVVARACAALPVLVEYALPFLRVGGSLVAWKAAMADAELHSGGVAARLLGGGAAVVVPTGIDALGDHRFVVVPKVAPTPADYPRRPGMATGRPLA